MKFIVRNHSGIKYVYYWCPGCKCAHSVPVERWHWNGNEESPTLEPSMRHYIPEHNDQPEITTCHYHLRKGILEYCGDGQHELKIPLQEIPEDYCIPDNDS